MALVVAALGLVVLALVVVLFAWVAKVAIDRTAEAGRAQTGEAVAKGHAANRLAALETSERFRQQEHRLRLALEEDISDLEAKLAAYTGVPSPDRATARNRVLRAVRAADAAGDGDARAAGAGRVVSGTIEVPLPSGGRGDAADPGDPDGGPGVR